MIKYELKSVGIWSFIRTAFFLNVIVGLVVGLISIPFVVVFMAMAATATFGDMPSISPEEFDLGGLMVGIPFLFSFFGAIFLTVIEAIVLALYNLFSRIFGGLELRLEPPASEPLPDSALGQSVSVSRQYQAPASSPPLSQAAAQPPPPPPPPSGMHSPPPPTHTEISGTPPSSPPPPRYPGESRSDNQTSNDKPDKQEPPQP